MSASLCVCLSVCLLPTVMKPSRFVAFDSGGNWFASRTESWLHWLDTSLCRYQLSAIRHDPVLVQYFVSSSLLTATLWGSGSVAISTTSIMKSTAYGAHKDNWNFSLACLIVHVTKSNGRRKSKNIDCSVLPHRPVPKNFSSRELENEKQFWSYITPNAHSSAAVLQR